MILSPVAVQAGTPDPILIRVSTGTTDDPVQQTVEAFGGGPVQLTVQLAASTAWDGKIGINLFRVSRGIAAPVLKGIEAVPSGELTAELRRHFTLTIDLPEVVSPTRFLLQLFATAGNNESATVIGRSSLLVYPPHPLKEFADALNRAGRERGVRLGVFGPAPGLRDFLKAASIPFEDLGDATPRAASRHQILLGSGAERSSILFHSPPQRLILFTAGIEDGIVRQTSDAQSILTEVPGDYLATISSSPSHQHLLAQLLLDSLQFNPSRL